MTTDEMTADLKESLQWLVGKPNTPIVRELATLTVECWMIENGITVPPTLGDKVNKICMRQKT